MIPVRDWKWYGLPGHFIGGSDCRFHLCTAIGKYLISTVGDYHPRSSEEREPIGHQRFYETMVFRTFGKCRTPGCYCGQPAIVPTEIDFAGYQSADGANRGHIEMCLKYAALADAEKGER